MHLMMTLSLIDYGYVSNNQRLENNELHVVGDRTRCKPHASILGNREQKRIFCKLNRKES